MQLNARKAVARRKSKKLTPRQAQVLTLIERGCSQQEIADRLGITPKTVKIHIHEVLKALGTATRYRHLATQLALAREQARAQVVFVTASEVVRVQEAVGLVPVDRYGRDIAKINGEIGFVRKAGRMTRFVHAAPMTFTGYTTWMAGKKRRGGG